MKRRFRVWQFIILLLIQLSLFLTLFMPILTLDSSKANSIAQAADSFGKDEDTAKRDVESPADEEDVGALICRRECEAVTAYFEENKTAVRISPLKVMTGDYKSLTSEKNPSYMIIGYMEEGGFNSLRMTLIFLYLFLAGVLILSVIVFAGNVNPMPLGIAATGFGLAGAGVIGYIRLSAIKNSILAVMSLDFGAEADHLSNQTSIPVADLISDEKLSEYAEKMAKVFGNAFATPVFWIIILLAVLVMIMGIVLIIAGGMKEIEESVPREESFEQARQAESVQSVFSSMTTTGSPTGIVSCIRGASAGQSIRLAPDEKVIVGKSRQRANLIIDSQYVSNVHCSIMYNPRDNSYLVKDHSSNGTLSNGMALAKEQRVKLPAGTILQLANGEDQLVLGRKTAQPLPVLQRIPAAQPGQPQMPQQQLQAQQMPQQQMSQQQMQPAMQGGRITVLQGVGAGQSIQLASGDKIVIGKSRQRANFILDAPPISNVHCSVAYQGVSNTYVVKDHSTNGTFTTTGRMLKDTPVTLPAGSVIYLADQSQQIRLG